MKKLILISLALSPILFLSSCTNPVVVRSGYDSVGYYDQPVYDQTYYAQPYGQAYYGYPAYYNNGINVYNRRSYYHVNHQRAYDQDDRNMHRAETPRHHQRMNGNGGHKRH